MMTVRNAEQTLPRTLASLAAQRGVSWELVVVDDGSTDGTAEILHTFEREYGVDQETSSPRGASRAPSRVRILPTGGIGRGPALNMAWSACTGTFIANLDADDLFHPDKLALQVRVLLANPRIAFLATGNLYLGANDQPDWVAIDTADRPGTPASSESASALEALPVRDLTNLLGRYNPINHSSVMMRRDALAAVGGYDATRRRQLDYELWIRAAERGCHMYCLDVPLSAKRLHAGQSFEAKPSIGYVWSSFLLQTRAIRALRLPPRNYLWAALRVLYRLSPAPIRRLFAGRKQRLLSSATSPTRSTHS